ncbi:hypothetical protein AWJ20_2312 [Sugiyamaella lignohabitans]|uniref:Xylanolytic transcriptional activator regulatory domain-containing protein n=1 Tax=Sugiyamaella lignohabitans TaxID=796027 RepID=A0A161HM82_9ASCO|nr:uncharacterized protein AWJ20_2312 [Sugiyamaella lignohabitans]ANB14707.1 hypothetical protein AWJ20_2312 [Sugiyamaella lignohabitans]
MTRQPYFRWLGPTAIAPPKDGTFRLLSVNLVSDEPDNGGKYVVVERQDKQSLYSKSSRSPTIPVREQIDTKAQSYAENLPPPPKSLYKLFNDKMANFLPYLPHDIFEERLADGVISECLLFAMASLAERMAANSRKEYDSIGEENDKSQDNTEGTDEISLAEKYAEAAKRLIIPHLSCPSVEIVFALLLIAYCEFGDDRDSGLWSWSGMAIRMCYDLGLQKANTNEPDSWFSRNVFWSVVCLDRLISCGTGRATTIPDSVIEYELQPRWVKDSDGKSRSDPFPYLCKLLLIVGKVSNYLNSCAESDAQKLMYNSKIGHPLSRSQIDMIEKFSAFQQEVSDFYTNLPPDLLFDVQNFQCFAKIKCSPVFLLLHIWNQALVLAVHQPSLVYPKCQLDITGLDQYPHAELTGSGAISIADMVTFADLIEPDSFLANPFLSQPIFMAACASLTLRFSLRAPYQSQPIYKLERTYNTCRQTLNRMETIWRGISWHSRTLDSLAASEPDVDLTINSKVYVTTKDLGVVRRASVDEATRDWLAGEIRGRQVDDIYGMFIAGTIDGGVGNNQYETSPSSTGTEPRSDGFHDIGNRLNENGMMLFDSPQPTSNTTLIEEIFKIF